MVYFARKGNVGAGRVPTFHVPLRGSDSCDHPLISTRGFFFRPFGASSTTRSWYPQLALWAAFLRRFAAGLSRGLLAAQRAWNFGAFWGIQ